MAQASLVLGEGVVGAVDDAEVLAAADLQAGLDQAAPTADQAVEGLDDHAFAAGRGELLPPGDGRFLGGRVGDVDVEVLGRGEQVGVRGVFLLDSKNWFGVVTVERGVPTVTPRDNPDAAWSWPRLTARLMGASAANKEAIQHLTGVRTWVQPIVVVWAPFEQRCVESNGVVFVAGKALAQWLSTQPQRLDNAAIGRIRACLSV